MSSPGSEAPERRPLRAPPSAPSVPPASRGTLGLVLQGLTLAGVLGVVAVIAWQHAGAPAGTTSEAARLREVASKLRAAGADAEAAAVYAEYLARPGGEPRTRASVAYSLGQIHLDGGQYERALRWFYEAESAGGGVADADAGTDGATPERVSEKIVHCLERLGRVQAAQAALGARTGLDGAAGGAADGVARPDSDPVVARIGQDEIRRSEVERSLDDLPPQLRSALANQKQEYLKKYVADELLWRKAQKLEIPDDAEVRRQLAAMLKQLSIARFIEKEVLQGITADEADLRTYHAANRELFDVPEQAQASVIKVADLATAQALRKKLQGGANFADLAKSDSLHAASRAQGGRLPSWIPRGDDVLKLGDPPAALLVSDGLFATAKGGLSEPIVAGGYAYLFMVHDKKAGAARPFEEVRAPVEQAYRRMKGQSAYANVIEEQLQSGDVEVFADRM